jgi:hypothetical protein
MARSPSRSGLGAGSASVALLAILCCGVLAASASAASLKVSVPSTVHPKQKYEIKITGAYKRSELSGTAYLVAYLQYSGHACKPTAKAERALPTSVWSLDFKGKEPRSPFTRIDNWQAGSIKGRRHVCAYMYPKVVSLASSVAPLVTASASFRNR